MKVKGLRGSFRGSFRGPLGRGGVAGGLRSPQVMPARPAEVVIVALSAGICVLLIATGGCRRDEGALGCLPGVGD